jgi:hypothetical protein
MKLKPFICYYGGKFRAAPKYPRSSCLHIVEPFAGSAGYSLRFPHRRVHLYDKNPVVCQIWEYLINCPESEIQSLPLDVTYGIDSLDICEEAKLLIGFWINKAVCEPKKTPSKWMREWIKSGSRGSDFWGPGIRNRIASQLKYIRHWNVENKCYKEIPNQKATWFIDPPYFVKGTYKFGNKGIDYKHLASWCLEREGQVIVCEQTGATWLPFRKFSSIRSLSGPNGSLFSEEVLYYKSSL